MSNVAAVRAAIKDVLTKRGELYELDFGLAAMSAYDGELSSALMNDAVDAMVADGELVEKFGSYKLVVK